MQHLSLKQKIGIYITIMIVIVVTVISFVTYAEFKEAMLRFIDDELHSQVQAVVSQTQSGEDISGFFSGKTSTQIGYGVWFDGEIGSLLESQTFGHIQSEIRRHSISPPKLSEYVIFDLKIDDRDCRCMWARYRNSTMDIKSGKTFNVIVVLSSGYAIHEIGEFLRVLVILGIVSVFITIGLVIFVVNWALKPIEVLIDRMNGISSRYFVQQDFVIDTIKDCPDELKPFVTAWNHMLERLAGFMRKQRQFTGDASHELRTPLAVVKSSLQVAGSQDRDLQYYKATINDCLEEVDRLEHLIEQLLELSDLDGKPVTAKSLVDLGALVLETAERYKDKAAANRQKIDCICDNVSIICNEQLIVTMISNLIENAIKYGPKDEKITVSVKRTDGQALFSVHDAGSAIDAEDIGKIFDRFYRCDKARSKDTGGRGLGLAIVKEIVDIHEGLVNVISQPGYGTDFTVSFKSETNDGIDKFCM